MEEKKVLDDEVMKDVTGGITPKLGVTYVCPLCGERTTDAKTATCGKCKIRMINVLEWQGVSKN